MEHIHTWNYYKDNKLCCSNCGLTYNQYLKMSEGEKWINKK